MKFLEQCRASKTPLLNPLHDYERTRLATLVSWCTVHRASELLGVSKRALTRAMQGEPVQGRVISAIVSGSTLDMTRSNLLSCVWRGR